MYVTFDLPMVNMIAFMQWKASKTTMVNGRV